MTMRRQPNRSMHLPPLRQLPPGCRRVSLRRMCGTCSRSSCSSSRSGNSSCLSSRCRTRLTFRRRCRDIRECSSTVLTECLFRLLHTCSGELLNFRSRCDSPTCVVMFCASRSLGGCKQVPGMPPTSAVPILPPTSQAANMMPRASPSAGASSIIF